MSGSAILGEILDRFKSVFQARGLNVFTLS